MSLPIRFDATLTRDFSRASTREWLETNGLGGWASSTVSGAHTRRYHGLLVVATQPPVGRMVLLSKLEETLILHGRVELGCNLFPGAVHPEGHRHLSSFSLDPFPTFTYAAREVTLRKKVAMIDGEHTAVVCYELMRAPGPVQLELRPFFAGRDYHHLMQANDEMCREAGFEEGVLRYRAYPGQPTVHIRVPGAHYRRSPDWHFNYQYPREEERGLDCSEDLFTCGVLHTNLEPGESLVVVISTDDPQGRDGIDLFEAERRRRTALVAPAGAGCRSVFGATRERTAHHSGGVPLVYRLGTGHDDRPAGDLSGDWPLRGGEGDLSGVRRPHQRGDDSESLPGRWGGT